jgi:hypothetical protein
MNKVVNVMYREKIGALNGLCLLRQEEELNVYDDQSQGWQGCRGLNSAL